MGGRGSGVRSVDGESQGHTGASGRDERVHKSLVEYL